MNTYEKITPRLATKVGQCLAAKGEPAVTRAVRALAEDDLGLAAKVLRYSQETASPNKDLVKFGAPVLMRDSLADKAIIAHLAVALFKQQPGNILKSIQLSRSMSRNGNPLSSGNGAQFKAIARQFVTARYDSMKSMPASMHKLVKYMYTWLHQTPPAWINEGLFTSGVRARQEKRQKPWSVYAQIASVGPKEAAILLDRYKPPLQRVLGALPKDGKYLDDPDFLRAVIDRMSAKQVTIYSRMLENHHVFEHPITRGAYDQAVRRAEADPEAASRLVAAAQKIGGETGQMLTAASERAFAQKTSMLSWGDKKVLIALDVSGSMEIAREPAARIAAYIAKVAADIKMVVFGGECKSVSVQAGMTLEKIRELLKYTRTGGGTSLTSVISHMKRGGELPDVLIVVTDGDETCGGNWGSAWANLPEPRPFVINVSFNRSIHRDGFFNSDDIDKAMAQGDSNYARIGAIGLTEAQYDHVLESVRDDRFGLAEAVSALDFYTWRDL